MMDAFDDRLDEAARALAERLPELDASLDDRIMARIRERAVDSPQLSVDSKPVNRRLSTVDWFLKPQPVRVRPVWLGLALAAVLVLLLVPRGSRTATPTAAVATADTVYVRFQVAAPAARNVAVAGSFNGWDAATLPLRRVADGSWEATIALPVGEHRYQFVVDGQRWIPDPSAQAQVDDGFGGTNSVIVVGPKGVVRS
jgi:hypothetical protein